VIRTVDQAAAGIGISVRIRTRFQAAGVGIHRKTPHDVIEQRPQLVKAVLDWLFRYLVPVNE
jgi:hypothetical protein